MQKIISPNMGGGASSLNEASPLFSRRSFVKMAAVSAGLLVAGVPSVAWAAVPPTYVTSYDQLPEQALYVNFDSNTVLKHFNTTDFYTLTDSRWIYTKFNRLTPYQWYTWNNPFWFECPGMGRSVDGRLLNIIVRMTKLEMQFEYLPNEAIIDGDFAIGSMPNRSEYGWIGVGYAADNNYNNRPRGTWRHHLSVEIRYADTGELFNQPILLGSEDVDNEFEITWYQSGVSESIWLFSPITDIWLAELERTNNMKICTEKFPDIGYNPDSEPRSFAAKQTTGGAWSLLGQTWCDGGMFFNIKSYNYPKSHVFTPKKTAADAVVAPGETMKFTVSQFCPWSDVLPSQFVLTDILDKNLDASKVTVVVKRDTGDAVTVVTGKFTKSISGQTLTMTCNDLSIARGTFIFEISVPVKKKVNWSGYAQGTCQGHACYEVTNKATSKVDVVTKTTNTTSGHVSFGTVVFDIDSANDSVSQLGQNDCYDLEGIAVGLYVDEACTVKIGEAVTDANGTVRFEEVPVGTKWVKALGAGDGFVYEGPMHSVEVLGLCEVRVDQDDVPQSEDLDGAIVSKRDAELESVGERKNWLLERLEELFGGMLR